MQISKINSLNYIEGKAYLGHRYRTLVRQSILNGDYESCDECGAVVGGEDVGGDADA